ncbi:DUF7288 family protein [Halodesulfurarchaeum formicicum]|uniref:Uncharacterized protein n=1 Tax=Halodesulfurarchaeum formicicum TaxID=1873524 RepID=A0A1J1AC56_9EURY|nr:hypothetical protein [Halodesulfurarchaeum formicicum]APE95726.1 hypothetical protein HSR6_1282 [Halodesulfurarchaeum formicicum]
MSRNEPRTRFGDRGQAHALEGIAAALLVLASLTFALQVTAVTPLTASTASQHLQTQGSGVANGVLVTADEADELKETVLYWNESASPPRFYDAGTGETYAGPPPTAFGDRLVATLGETGMVYNVNLRYLSSTGDQRVRTLVDQGNPSDQAVTASRTVVLYDDDQLRAADGSRTDRTVSETSGYFAHDTAPGPLYNVIRVEVVVWRV